MAARMVLPVKSTSSTKIISLSSTEKGMFEGLTVGWWLIFVQSSRYMLMSMDPTGSIVPSIFAICSARRFARKSPRVWIPTKARFFYPFMFFNDFVGNAGDDPFVILIIENALFFCHDMPFYVFGYALKVFSTIFFLARQHLDFLSDNSKFYSRTKPQRHKGAQSRIKIFVSWCLCASFN